MKPINICHVSTMTRRGGVETLLTDFLLNSNQNSYRHLLLTTSNKPEILQPIKQAGILHFQPLGIFRFDPLKIVQMARWMRFQNIQVVQSYNAFANAWANLATIIAKIPLITYEHGTIWQTRPPLEWLDRWAHRRAKIVIANSNASALLLEKRYGIPSEKIRVIFNAVPKLPSVDIQSLRSDWGIKKEKYVVGSVGRLEHVKNFSTFIRAAACLLNIRKDVIFMIVGGGDLENSLKTLVVDLGIADYFIFTGWRAEARSLIQLFDVFVNTSIRESFGNVLVEAALSGIVVIAPWIDGVPDVVVHGETGILLIPTIPFKIDNLKVGKYITNKSFAQRIYKKTRILDPEVLALTISKLLSRSDIRRNYGRNARIRAKKIFSLPRYIMEIETIYQSIEKRR